jgi:hypothetical protein
LKLSDRVLTHPQQHEQARRGERRHDDERHRDTNENRQETNPAGDGANCFHDVPFPPLPGGLPSRREPASMILL